MKFSLPRTKGLGEAQEILWLHMNEAAAWAIDVNDVEFFAVLVFDSSPTAGEPDPGPRGKGQSEK
jgi:hypothetical protein